MKPWVITWAGMSWSNDDLVAGDLAAVAALTEDGWAGCDPWAGPVELMAMIAVLVARSTSASPRKMLEQLALCPASDVMGAIAVRV